MAFPETADLAIESKKIKYKVQSMFNVTVYVEDGNFLQLESTGHCRQHAVIKKYRKVKQEKFSFLRSTQTCHKQKRTFRK